MNNPSPASFLATIERFESASVLVVGDVMLDHFVYGEAERISPEEMWYVILRHLERGQVLYA